METVHDATPPGCSWPAAGHRWLGIHDCHTSACPAQVTSPTHKLHFISSHRKTYFHIFALFTLIYFVHFSFQGHCFLHRRGVLHSHWPIDCIKWFYFKNSFQKVQLINPLFLKIILKRLKLKEEISLKMSENFVTR